MDAYSIHGDHYHQGYPVQAPPPGTAPNQMLPPGAVPAQAPAPASTPLAPPGVAPSPSSTAASYYGTHAPPSYGYLPSSAERWNSFPIPAAEPHPYASYPPTTPYDRPGYGHHPHHQRDPFLYAHRFPSPPQAYMSFPPRGTDVTRFRKKRPFLPHHNLRPKNKPFKQPQENLRGGGKKSQQVKRTFNSDPRGFNVAINGFPNANDTQILQPLWQGRANEVPANRVGKKRRMDEKGEGRPGRNDERRKGDKRARPGWNKGKRKKGRKQGGDKNSMDPNTEAKGTSPTKGADAVPVTEEQAQEAAVGLELHRDVRRRVQEFLLTSEKESFQKSGTQDTQGATLMGTGGDANARMQQDTQEPTPKAAGGDASVEMGDIQEGRREAAGGVANAESQDTKVEIGGDANAEMQDTQEAAEGSLNAEMHDTEAKVHADANAHVAKNDVAAQLDAEQARNVDVSQDVHMNAFHSNCTEENKLDHMCGAQFDRADLLLASAHIDAVQSEGPHDDEVNIKKLDIVDILKNDCENAPWLATEFVQNLEAEGVQECPGADEVKRDHNNQKPSLETAHNLQDKRPEVESAHNLQEKRPEAPTEEELKVREEKAFDFFTKLLEENKDLRNMYIEKCNNGAFECLMCHSKIKKRFSNLVSLVTHASNVLKTKKLPEHRGYGRAVCALFGWDPQKYPKVLKSQVPHYVVENVPADEERALTGDGYICGPAGDAVEHTHAADAMKDGLGVDAVKGTPVGNATENIKRAVVAESAPSGEGDKGVHTADAVEGECCGETDQTEPRGEVDESTPLGDADERATLMDIGSSVEQGTRDDLANIVDGGGIGKEHIEDWKDIDSVNELGNELVEEGDIIEVAKSLQSGAEVI